MNPLATLSAIAPGGAFGNLADAAANAALGGAKVAAAATMPIGGASFVDALGDVAGRVIGTMKQSESLSLQALSGGDVTARDVADAVMSAEQSLQAAIAIRDKIVSAYLEVSRMAI